MPWYATVGLVVLGFAAEFAAEVWSFRYTNAITGRYKGLSKDAAASKVWASRKWGALLWGLTQVDIGGASYGPRVYFPIMLGAAFGMWLGIGHAVHGKWARINGGKPEEGDDDGE